MFRWNSIWSSRFAVLYSSNGAHDFLLVGLLMSVDRSSSAARMVSTSSKCSAHLFLFVVSRGSFMFLVTTACFGSGLDSPYSPACRYSHHASPLCGPLYAQHEQKPSPSRIWLVWILRFPDLCLLQGLC